MDAVTRPGAEELTFVMPLTLNECARMGSDAGWRSNPDAGIQVRLELLIRSFLSHFDLRDLCQFLIISPDGEQTQVKRAVRSVTHDPRFVVASETEICPEASRAVDPQTGVIRGWYVQQLLKLAAAQRVTTPHYVTYDSDIVTLRAFSATDLVDQGRAVCGVENAAVYESIYTPDFALRESRNKQQRADVAQTLLGGDREPRYVGRYYSETPTVYGTGAMRAMCDHLSAVHGRPWASLLAETTGWTEQSLYFHYVEQVGRLEALHVLAGPNRILHLAGSVWQRSEYYNHARPYDAAHFRDIMRADSDGIFVAIQSWLPTDSWLPQTGCDSLEAFYTRLGEILSVSVASAGDKPL